MLNKEKKTCSLCDNNFQTRELCETCEETGRIYQQKFTDLHGNEQEAFRSKVLEQIICDKTSIRELISYYQKKLGAEIFQHQVDISIGVKFAIKHLFETQQISLYDDKEKIYPPMNEEQYVNLIVEMNGFISRSKETFLSSSETKL